MRHKAASYIGRSSYVGWPSTAPLSHLRSTSGRFAPTSHLPHPVAVIAFAAWSGSVLFFLCSLFSFTQILWYTETLMMHGGRGRRTNTVYFKKKGLSIHGELNDLWTNFTYCVICAYMVLYAVISCYLLLKKFFELRLLYFCASLKYNGCIYDWSIIEDKNLPSKKRGSFLAKLPRFFR